MTQQQARPRSGLPSPYQAKRSKLWLWITLGASPPVLAGLIAYAYYFGMPDLTSPPTTHTVVYRVEADTAYGSGRTGMVTLQTDDGGTSQDTGLLPIASTFGEFHSGDFVYVSVQNRQHAGSVTCSITVDGEVVSSNTSTGGYTIATCMSRVP